MLKTVFSNPVGNYMFKVNYRNTRARCEICSKFFDRAFEFSIHTPKARSRDFGFLDDINLISYIWVCKILKIIKSPFSGNCMKSVQIQSFFWSVFSHIRTEYRAIRAYLDTFHAVGTVSNILVFL